MQTIDVVNIMYAYHFALVRWLSGNLTLFASARRIWQPLGFYLSVCEGLTYKSRSGILSFLARI
jgi:hypothetical protein